MRSRFTHALILLLSILLASCGSLPQASAPTPTLPPATAMRPPTPTPPPTPTRAVAAATQAVAPTSQAVDTALPTATAQPTTAPTDRPTAEPTEPPAPTALPITPLSDLPNLDGQEVTVQGAVVWAASFSKGFNFTLDDGTGRATLTVWSDVYDDCWDAPRLLVGATVRATGEVSQYEGEWELQAGYGGDVKVLSEGTPLPVRPISSITSADVSTRVAVEGTVSSVKAFNGGQSVYVTDDSGGEIRLVVWQAILDRVQDNARLLTPGTRVHVEGGIDEYKGSLELVPQVPYNVTVLP